MINLIKNIILLFLIPSIAFSNRQYKFSISDRDYLINEMLSINANSVKSSNFIFPYISDSSNDSYDIMNNNRYASLYPILGFRYSNSSFEIFPDYVR